MELKPIAASTEFAPPDTLATPTTTAAPSEATWGDSASVVSALQHLFAAPETSATRTFKDLEESKTWKSEERISLFRCFL
ncbi:hypothetical protein L596_011211 [Steinernema carpocapsae]|uniref:Uncharacterized protein n=1 Tax=Steinernema carpocapsae TaxID=34508 RepID=A0A4U5NTM8_STECR|nr:hypothetical protein L596_011211 [Steinernema carpocapsae]